MPVIRFREADLERLLGKHVTKEELVSTIPLLGADIDDVSGPEWAIEFFPDRPDLYTVEGIARAMRQFLGIAPGLAHYNLRAPAHTITVDRSVFPIRPHIAGAFLRNLVVDDRILEELIALQEDLHWGIGARRRKVAIGIHDARDLHPPFTYRAALPDEVRFVPLASDEPMTLREILTKHPKGQEFAHLVRDQPRWPVIEDSKKQVLSFPPIINGALTTVRAGSRDLFLDVTGTDAWAVGRALNLLATSLAEAGGTIEAVRLDGAHHAVTPDLTPSDASLSVERTNRLLGTTFSADEVAQRLQNMGFGARAAGGNVAVQVPPYRADILHDVDLIEDVAIGGRIDRFDGAPLRSVTAGKALPGAITAEKVRTALVGQGFLEILSLSLSNDEEQFLKMGREPAWAARVKNPATTEHTLLRISLLPSVLNVLSRNTHRELPQRLFEVGMATIEGKDHQPMRQRRVAGVAVDAKVGFSDAKSMVLGLARDMGWGLEVEAAEDPQWTPGRGAKLAGRVGTFGELHPRTLNAYGIGYPAVGFEFAL
ncbi:MAG: phenylalanine--tRNA ligase subunit beta [Thermoplasmatota archaeon]